MKFDASVLPLISISTLSVSPAAAQAALRGLQSGRGESRGGRSPPSIGEGRGGGVDAFLGGDSGELSTYGKTRMIVKFDKVGHEGPATKCDRLARLYGGEREKVFHKAMKGCTIVLSNKAVASMGRNTMVKSMEPDREVRAHAQIEDPTWGLDRIDQCGAIGTEEGEPYTQMNADGVRVYILDTGVHGSHPALAQYMSSSDCHIDLAGEGNAQIDGHGHGTHVAGTACGDQWGVSTNCEICAIKVLGQGGKGSTGDVIDGIEHVMEDCPEGTKCVANMSLGGPASQNENEAVNNAVDQGVVFVVSAGNWNENACNQSPASAEDAITVGSMTRSERHWGSSNWGECVDVDAPGSDVTSSWPPDGTNTISGTSMASPHVAGLAAGLMGEAGLEAAEIVAEIKARAKSTGILDNGGRQIRVANNKGGCNPPTPPPTLAPTPPPCTPQQVKIQVKLTTDDYPAETSWNVMDSSGEEVFQGGSYSFANNLYEDESECLEPGSFTFTINDSYDDGICCDYGQGSYEVLLNNVSKGSGGSFGAQETVAFDSHPAPTSAPTSAPTPLPAVAHYEAEVQQKDNWTRVQSSHSGYLGSGYMNMGGLGSYVKFADVDGGVGGTCTLDFRYANGGNTDRPLSVLVNRPEGTPRPEGTLAFPSTGGWTTWGTETIEVACHAGSNEVHLIATSDNGPNLDSLDVTRSLPSTPAPPPLPVVAHYEAEVQQKDSTTHVKSSNAGYLGNGYMDMGGFDSYVRFADVDGGVGGTCTLDFRYANGGNTWRPLSVAVNGVFVLILAFPNTGGWTTWGTETIEVACHAGSNEVLLTATSDNGPNLDSLDVTLPPTPSAPDNTLGLSG